MQGAFVSAVIRARPRTPHRGAQRGPTTQRFISKRVLKRALVYRGASDELGSEWVTVNGLRVHWRASTAPTVAGPTVVLVHGLGVSGRYLLPTAARLAPRSRVLVPDLPGAGPSEKPPAALDVAGLADALAAWLDAVEIERAAFVGSSLGCQTIVELAATKPERVDRLVLIGPSMDVAAPTFGRQLGRLLLDATREPAALVALAATEYLLAGIPRVVTTARAALRHPMEERLRHVEAPTLVVRGERDPIASQAWTERIVDLLARGRLTVIPRAPHATNYSTADVLATIVLSFLAD
jgi:2-hydroxy-6-oxonona-2,4-dienedioate hydrolase